MGEGGVEGVHEVIENGSALLGAGGQNGPDAFAAGASGRAVPAEPPGHGAGLGGGRQPDDVQALTPPQSGQASSLWSCTRSTRSGENGGRSCLGCPGCPPILRLDLLGLPEGGGPVMSLEGGLEEVEEFLRAAASSACAAVRACSSRATRRVNEVFCSRSSRTKTRSSSRGRVSPTTPAIRLSSANTDRRLQTHQKGLYGYRLGNG